jgi:hypothetical protein
VTDAGLRELRALKQLRTLSLDTPKATSAALKGLAALKQLRTLSIGYTTVTDADLGWLRRALPGCEIQTSQVGGLPHALAR